MVKIRLQGTVEEMNRIIRILSKTKGIRLEDFSKPFKNGGTDMYRIYGNIEKETTSERKGE